MATSGAKTPRASRAKASSTSAQRDPKPAKKPKPKKPSFAKHPPASVDAVEIEILGKPAPKGNLRAFVIKGTNRASLTEGGANADKLRAWASSVREAARMAVGSVEVPPFIRTSLAVTILFRMSRIAGHYGTGKNAGKLKPDAPETPAGKPDADKLIRATMDALTGIVFDDDSRIARFLVDKVYASPGDEGAVIIVEKRAGMRGLLEIRRYALLSDEKLHNGGDCAIGCAKTLAEITGQNALAVARVADAAEKAKTFATRDDLRTLTDAITKPKTLAASDEPDPPEPAVRHECGAKPWPKMRGKNQPCTLSRNHEGRHHNGERYFLAAGERDLAVAKSIEEANVECGRRRSSGAPCELAAGHDGPHGGRVNGIWRHDVPDGPPETPPLAPELVVAAGEIHRCAFAGCIGGPRPHTPADHPEGHTEPFTTDGTRSINVDGVVNFYCGRVGCTGGRGHAHLDDPELSDFGVFA